MKDVYGVDEENSLDRIFQLESISSTLEKQKIIRELNGAEMLFFHLMLDPFQKYNVTAKRVDADFKKVIATKVTDPVSINVLTLHNLKYILFELNQRIVTGNSAVKRIKDFYDKQELPLKKLILSILNKDFGKGVGKRLINKSLAPGQRKIPTFELMLCDNMKTKELHNDWSKLSFPCYGELKLNGVRVIYMKRNGKIECLSRAGKEYLNFHAINKEVETILQGVDNVFLDGEIHGETFDKVMEVARAKTLDTPDIDTTFEFTAWDYSTTELFDGVQDKTPLHERRKNLAELIGNNKLVNITPQFLVENAEEAQELLQTWHDAGEEGAVFKNINGLYRTKRHKDWMKGKLFFEDTFEVIGTTEHNKKFGQLGALICKMDDSDETFKVGSGFSDEQRIDYWNRREELVGMEAEVQYKERSKNTLQFPVLIKLRTDRL